jgi:hypothetical protein
VRRAVSRVVLAVVVVALVGINAPRASAATPWSVQIDGNTVGARVISNPDSTVRLELTNHTALIEANPYVTAILKAIGRDTGYSQTATWTTGKGPALACPTPGVNLLCWSTAAGGKVVIIGSIRSILLATASDQPDPTTLMVGTTAESMAVDLVLAAVSIAFDALGGSLTASLSSEVVALVTELLPEAMGFRDAVVHGDLAAAESELQAAATRAAAVIIEHAVSWGLSALAYSVLPGTLQVRLALGVIKVAPALLTMLAASLAGRHSTVSVANTTGAAGSAAAGSGGSGLDWAGTVWAADWSGGLDGWIVGSGWTTVGGLLVSDGSRGQILAPYEPPGTVLAVEAEVQIVRVINAGSLTGRADMGIVVRASPEGGGFVAGYCTSALVITPCSDNGQDFGIYTTAGERLESSPATPGDGWHTYLMTVRDNSLTLSIDGAVVAQTADNRYLDGTMVGFGANGIEVSLRSFRVLSP